MGKQNTGMPEPEQKRGKDNESGALRWPAVLPEQDPKPSRRGKRDNKKQEPTPELKHRGLLDSDDDGYQLRSRSEGLYPELYQPVNKEFWRGVSTEQADALMHLQAIAMEKVGFEKGTPKFFIDDDPGSQYAADDYFVGSERARVPTPKSPLDLNEAEIAYAARRAEKERWFKARKDKRKRALQRESEADGGMNFLAATQAERLAQETAMIAAAQLPAVIDFDGPSLLIGGMLIGLGLFFGFAGLMPLFIEEYAEMIAKILPTAGFICAAFGVVVVFNHMRS